MACTYRMRQRKMPAFLGQASAENDNIWKIAAIVKILAT